VREKVNKRVDVTREKGKTNLGTGHGVRVRGVKVGDEEGRESAVVGRKGKREDEETKRWKRKVDERWCGLLGRLKHSVLSRFDF
jgi:hypothetical protein